MKVCAGSLGGMRAQIDMVPSQFAIAVSVRRISKIERDDY
jgi:hypothetical protein